jgi:hypothetical protein
VHGSTRQATRNSIELLPPASSFSGRAARILRGRRAGFILAGLVLLATAGLGLGLRPSCGCAIPPIPNLLAFEVGGRFLNEGNYQAAASTFDLLLHDQNSSEIYAEALYGRGLSKRAMGQADAGNVDLTAARKLQSRVAELFEMYSQAAR